MRLHKLPPRWLEGHAERNEDESKSALKVRAVVIRNRYAPYSNGEPVTTDVYYPRIWMALAALLRSR